MRFIGEVDDAVVEEIALSLDRVLCAPMTIALFGEGSFASRGRPNSLWIGMPPSSGLAMLRDRVGEALHRAGIAPDPRAFLPHVTVARLSRGSGSIDWWIADVASFASAPFQIETFGLYESKLGRDGSVYDLVAHYPLR